MSQRDRLLDQVRRVALQGMGERRTDGQLLEHFISQRDEAAFALLLQRHGAMVWSVCRRVLGNPHDADDAFQAAFLVLVRKAESVRPREAVGNWLYGVAYRTALEARSRIARSRAKELSLRDVPSASIRVEETRQELWPILDRELSRLADKYRLPIVLCDLEGRSRKEVAQQLAIPEGTLSSRLATARKKLAARLTRLGFVLSGVSLATLLSESTATATIGPTLFPTTTKAALLVAAVPAGAAGVVSATVSTLTEGVLKTMFIAKIKMTALVLCSVAALGVGTGGVYYQTRAGADSPQEVSSDQKPTTKAKRKAKQNTEDWRQIAEDLRKQLESEREKAKLREQELRSDMAKLRDETIVLRAKINAMKFQAEAREKNVQEVLKRKLGQHAAPTPNPEFELEQLEQERKRLLKELQGQWDDLQKGQKELAEKQKILEDDLRKKLVEKQKEFKDKEQQLRELASRKVAELDDRKARIQRGQATNQQNSPNAQASRGDDKLDQILQRLKQLEDRIDRVEQRRR